MAANGETADGKMATNGETADGKTTLGTIAERLYACCIQPNDAGADELNESIQQHKGTPTLASALNSSPYRCPTHAAAKLDNVECLTLLLNAGASPDERNGPIYRTIIQSAIIGNGGVGGIKCIELIYYAEGIQCLMECDRDGNNAAHVVMSFDRNDVLKWFQDNLPADEGRMLFDAQDLYGFTPIPDPPTAYSSQNKKHNHTLEVAQRVMESFKSPMIKSANKEHE